jgi:predicted DNA-binding protein
MSEKMLRMSFTVPREVYDDLNEISQALGITKSAVVAQVLGATLRDMLELVQHASSIDTPDGLKRFRGKSESLIEDKLAQFRREQRDLFGS